MTMTGQAPSRVSAFANYADKSWPYEFHGTIEVGALAGGIPSNPNIVDSWLRTHLPGVSDHDVELLVAETMVDRNLPLDQAVSEVGKHKHLVGFKRDPDMGLYIEGRNLKAAMKEAVSCAVGSGKLDLRKWGFTSKYITNFFPEHVFVSPDRLYLRHQDTGLPLHEPDRVLQSFPRNPRTGQTGIQMSEICTDVAFDFVVISDHPFTPQQWAMIWTTGELQGLGAQRSQGLGVYKVTRWEQVRGTLRKPAASGDAPPDDAAPDDADDD
jgi:hypothetical protein